MSDIEHEVEQVIRAKDNADRDKLTNNKLLVNQLIKDVERIKSMYIIAILDDDKPYVLSSMKPEQALVELEISKNVLVEDIRIFREGGLDIDEDDEDELEEDEDYE